MWSKFLIKGLQLLEGIQILFILLTVTGVVNWQWYEVLLPFFVIWIFIVIDFIMLIFDN